ncbi:MAG: uroporphyrinogen-III C-methyltransferase [Leptospiraceae bacterium]|nr:uroporphyrinogen-III C-methyltransferase [Leptospiraceae bacterium]MCP5503198.1 uroporphyrinogen-III C-methyltransferase [Leptospiraceae bacterium]
MDIGFVSLVGAGPGDPELISLKGFKAIQKAELILYDALLCESYKELFPKSSESIFVGKRCGKHSHSQEEINHLLVLEAKRGKRVLRLKGGDPFLFGRGGEEVLALIENEIPYEIIPGISSAQAASAQFQIPLTHRGLSRKVLYLNGHGILKQSPSEWKELADFKGTIVIFMGMNRIQDIANILIHYGAKPETPISIMENVSFPGSTMSFSSLSNMAINGNRPKTTGPGIIVIGEVVKFALNIENLEYKSFLKVSNF